MTHSVKTNDGALNTVYDDRNKTVFKFSTSYVFIVIIYCNFYMDSD